MGIFKGIITLFLILASCLAAWLLCDIEPNETYTWYSGIWQGLFSFPNFILSLFTDTLCKAELYTTAYNVFWWIFAIPSYVFGLTISVLCILYFISDVIGFIVYR